MTKYQDKIIQVSEWLFKICVLGPIIFVLLTPFLNTFILAILFMAIISLLYFPNAFLLRNGAKYGLIGSLISVLFLFILDVELFFHIDSVSLAQVLLVMIDAVLLSGILGYALLSISEKTYFKSVENIVIYLLSVLIIIDIMLLWKFDTNIAIYFIKQGFGKIYTF
jgi:hypothetical protein